MNILFAHDTLGAYGGAETNILLTAGELAKRGHRVDLLYRHPTGRGEATWEEIFSTCFQLASADVCDRGVLRCLGRLQPDLIYLHSVKDLKVLNALVNSSVPVIRMVHDHQMYCLRGYKYNYFTRVKCTRPTSFRCVFPCLAPIARSQEGLGIRWASYKAKKKEIELNKGCTAFIAYSEYAKGELVRNGFDPARIEVHTPIRCWGLDGPKTNFSERNLLLYVGQIIRGKGVDVLLKALARVRPPFECHILGDGIHRSRCERLCARLGLSGRVRFRGYVPPDELEKHYLEATALLFSSVWPEPFGMAGPEAMRYGVPVVGFDAGGVREWLADGENGYLVPWMDVKCFAMRVEALLNDKALARRLGRRGMERVNEEFEAVRQVDALEALFGRVVRERQEREVAEPATIQNCL